ncbi:Hap43p-repressed protein, partial [Candida albicans P75016]
NLSRSKRWSPIMIQTIFTMEVCFIWMKI